MDHQVTHLFEHIVLKAPTWALLDLAKGQHLSTSHPFDVYTDRDEAIAAMLQHNPEFEPEPWDFDVQARIAELRQKLIDTDYVGLADYDKDQPKLKAKRQQWRDEIRELQERLDEV